VFMDTVAAEDGYGLLVVGARGAGMSQPPARERRDQPRRPGQRAGAGGRRPGQDGPDRARAALSRSGRPASLTTSVWILAAPECRRRPRERPQASPEGSTAHHNTATSSQEGIMTPVVLMLLFVLVVDLLVLLGWSHDSRDGRDWQPRDAPSPDRSAVGLA
jgi:hypothetical protein